MFTILAQTATEGSFPFISVFFALIGGVLIGYFWGKSGTKPDIQRQLDEAAREASEKALRKYEDEKIEISRDLNEQLLKVRDSIVQTVSAYGEVTRSVAANLPAPPQLEEGEKSGTPLPLELKGEEPLREPIDVEAESEPDEALPEDPEDPEYPDEPEDPDEPEPEEEEEEEEPKESAESEEADEPRLDPSGDGDAEEARDTTIQVSPIREEAAEAFDDPEEASPDAGDEKAVRYYRD